MSTHFTSTFDQNDNLIAWKAILGGVVIALSITVVFNLIGLGLGFTAFLLDTNVLAKMGLTSVVWLLLCSIISMFLGGWVSSRVSPFPLPQSGTILSGLITWAVVTLITFSLMISSVGGLLSGGAALIERTATLTAQGAGAILNTAGKIAPAAIEAAQNVAPDAKELIKQISEEAEPVLDVLDNPKPTAEAGSDKSISLETAKKRLKNIISLWLNADTEEEKSAAKSKAITFLMQTLHMNEQTAQETINQWQSSYEKAKEKMNRKAEEAKENAIAAAEKVSHTIGKMALLTAIINLLGAIAAVIGSVMGSNQRRATV
ncbi:MAG: hypothetical protein K0S27_33 [Gammaproteobacteria bacterium]|jgi:hypothetical protein|nr:hypothetical protein [Gammaproteobacteria bacterium]